MATPLFNAQELALYHQNENANRYQDLKNRAEKSASRYDFNPFDAKTYGNFGNWLANGVSGGGWTHNDRMKNAGFGDEVDSLGKSGQLGGYALGQLNDAFTGSMRDRTNQLEAGKGLFSGIPIVGDFISAPTQVVSAGKDLAESGTSKWQSGKRDWLSDLGALGETAIDVATLGGIGGIKEGLKAGVKVGSKEGLKAGMKAGLNASAKAGAKAGAKTLGKAVGKGALLGSGYGFTGSLNDMGVKNFDAGRLGLSTALGAVIGGGIGGVGYGLGKAWNKYSQPAPSTSTEIVPYTGANATPSAKYQNALNTLKEAGIDTTSPETVNKTFKKFSLANHPDRGGSEAVFKKVSSAKTQYQDFLKSAGKGSAKGVAYTAPELSFSQKLKNFGSNIPNMGKDLKKAASGTKVAGLLRTKKGKIGAGIGGGLLLAQLLKGKKNNQEMSDEELYNYIYGGGQ